MTAPPETTIEVTAIVRLYRDLGASIAALEEQRAALRNRFDGLVPLGYVIDVDGKAAAKMPPARAFDLGTAIVLAHRYGINVTYVQTADASDLRDRLKAIGKLDEAMLAGRGNDRVVLG